MGILSDIAKGRADYINGDSEILSDSRNWPALKKADAHSRFTKEEVETTTDPEDGVESATSNDEE